MGKQESMKKKSVQKGFEKQNKPGPIARYF